MDPILISVVTIGVLLLLIAIGIPVAFAMAGVAAVGMWTLSGLPFMLVTFQNLPYAVATDFAFLVVPMFILMGALTATAGITSELYTLAYRWTSGIRGSLYYTTIFAAGAFGAINGSTVVSAVLFTKIALPEMERFRYPLGLSAGCVCAAGTFAALIPPSVAMVLYAILTGESVGALLMAGILPGLLTIGIYVAGLAILIRLRPELAPETTDRFSLREKLEALRGLWALAVLVIIVMGGIYSGVMFPSTAGAAGAVGALLIALLRRKLSWDGLLDALRQSVSISAVIFLIIIGGLLLSRLLLVSGSITELNDMVATFGLSPLLFMAIVVVIYLVLGMFIDTISIMVMTIPFLYPLAKSVGVDPIWFGVIIVKLVEIAAISPPVGFNLYAVISASDRRVSSQALFRGVAPFLALELLTLGLLLYFPTISLWIPGSMFK